MTPTEELIYKLGKDVAVMAQTQERTTQNIDKLTTSVETIAREAIRLEAIFGNLTKMEIRVEKIEAVILDRPEVVERLSNLVKKVNKLETAYATWSKAVIGAIFVASVGLIFKYIGA